ncbi:tRNA guanosine(34) transglycosylase Tgt [Ponticaulis sp.]|uniref:tRNA guanosine(34) transglycosylase Tgt n=1 Tax=Ponticaulis sp. TaxID=2020902 RepID=UPI000B697219|nr:tRNA guanosine(34) transglycosylase Tgt [Ponticaulis sp.]MAI92116.1 tRNA guanosine(34) transglycosylase Tgt [Ponticaulis sp.]OUX96289.1 MAG: tRNA guanosine(34) transglycosylase Tgt [Hyphomonadaceae bacterium TMED5]|tara:strand:+ start:87088 stop:88200 length:1113 start_codon:yes stop_codon:yes gene_type:complete
MTDFPFEILGRENRARTGVLKTSRGDIRTPAFMPVGTVGTVKALYSEQVADAGADIVLGNTYHLMLRPGSERVHRLGGLHKFMRWEKPILTDSGGFQVWSLAGLRKMKEEGVSFKSHIDGSTHFLSPERSIEIQADHLGADISMQLDECTAYPVSHEEAKSSMEMSIRWGARSKAAFGERDTQNLFGIVQGSDFEDLRRQSAEQLQEIGFGGYAIGGLAVGEGHERMVEVIDFTEPHLPQHRPRYLMGVGKPIDILEAVAHGVDMFDCVLPTRSGRHGQAWTWDGPINLKNAKFAEDDTPIDETSSCPATRDYSKAYLNHLFKSGEYLAAMVLSWHNTAFFQELMSEIRVSIAEGRFETFRAELKSRWAK